MPAASIAGFGAWDVGPAGSPRSSEHDLWTLIVRIGCRGPLCYNYRGLKNQNRVLGPIMLHKPEFSGNANSTGSG